MTKTTMTLTTKTTMGTTTATITRTRIMITRTTTMRPTACRTARPRRAPGHEHEGAVALAIPTAARPGREPAAGDRGRYRLTGGNAGRQVEPEARSRPGRRPLRHLQA